MLGCVLSCVPSADGETPASVKIPSVDAVVLTGERVVLPSQLKGKVGVLVVGFSQGSREQVAEWGRRLATDYPTSDTVVYYEMAELEAVPRVMRGLVLRQIKKSVPERAQRRFLPLLDHQAEWKSVTGFRAADDAYVVVVDGAGAVRWRAEGAPTDATYAEVKRRVEAVATK